MGFSREKKKSPPRTGHMASSTGIFFPRTTSLSTPRDYISLSLFLSLSSPPPLSFKTGETGHHRQSPLSLQALRDRALGFPKGRPPELELSLALEAARVGRKPRTSSTMVWLENGLLPIHSWQPWTLQALMVTIPPSMLPLSHRRQPKRGRSCVVASNGHFSHLDHHPDSKVVHINSSL